MSTGTSSSAALVEPLTERRSIGCSEIVAQASVAGETIADLLPPGFRPSLSAAGGSASLVVNVSRSEETRIGSDTILGSTLAIGLVLVEPPSDLRLPDAEFHALTLFTIIDGEVNLECERLASGSRRVRALASRGSIGLTIESEHSPDERDVPGGWARVFVGGPGGLRAVGDLAFSAAVASLPATAFLKATGVPALPESLECTALYQGGFDVRLTPVDWQKPSRTGSDHR